MVEQEFHSEYRESAERVRQLANLIGPLFERLGELSAEEQAEYDRLTEEMMEEAKVTVAEGRRQFQEVADGKWN